MTVACPKGHSSETPDYCDVCGLRIDGPSPEAPPAEAAGATQTPEAPGAATPSPSPAAAPPGPGAGAGAGDECPACGTHNAIGTRFCENCGADLTAAPPLAPAGPRWEAVVSADRAYFDRLEPAGMTFPADYRDRCFALHGDEVTIGRRFRPDFTAARIDLSPDPEDTGVSHRHAVLVADGEDSWSVVDPGSTNGTYLNDGADAIAVDEPVRLRDGDHLHIGAWTTITVHRPI